MNYRRHIMRNLAAATALCLSGSAMAQTGVASGPVQRIPASVVADRPGPNVLVVLMDDVGFGADSSFGGPIPTPNLDALAAQGLRYNRFHTTAMCSPTRAALLTGRNHHRVEMGSITNLALGNPGYTSVIPKTAATIGRVLQLNGYNTAWFGKNHLTPEWEQTAAGPFDRWPTGLGFDYFYGFMDGASDQFAPTLIENTTALDPQTSKDYILDQDLTDHAVSWIDAHVTAAPAKPFFIYLAPGSAHEPHQAPAAWMAKFRGTFDQGWDKVREATFARQKSMGIVPSDTKLTPRPDILPAWDSLSPDEKRIAAREMEAHAAQRAYFDDQFGRLVAELKRTGQWDNTLVIFIDGDNGGSGEGGPKGTELGLLNRPKESVAYDLAHIDDIGGPKGASNYPAAWAWAMNAPFQWFKQIASYLGGQRDGMVVSWPARIRDQGKIRSQYGHVNDIAPTIYEAAGIEPPKMVDGVAQTPFDGTSLVYSFTQAAAPSRHRLQYYEMLGNAALYKDGWLASRGLPNIMWAPDYGKTKRWELYDLDHDYSQSTDLAARFPAKLAELKAEFGRQEKANGFEVLDVPLAARGNPMVRPSRWVGRPTVSFAPSARPLLDSAFPSIVNRKWTLTVPVDIATGHESGTLVSQGGYPYGWGLYVFDGVPSFLYRNEPEPFAKLQAPASLSPGHHVIEIGMTPLDGQPGGPAVMSLRVDGGLPVEFRLPSSVPTYWGGSGVGIGRDVGSVIEDGIIKPFAFTGKMDTITFNFGN